MRRRLPPPWALTALAALAYALVPPPSTDLAAQTHRVALGRDGVWLVDLSWFGGHHLPGYSVLMPLLGLLLAPATITALAAVAAAWAFHRLVAGLRPGRPAVVASWWFAAGVAGLQFTGRTTFVLGTAVALGTLLVARGRPGTSRVPTGGRRSSGSADRDAPAGLDARGTSGVLRAPLAALGAALTALASPVAALFLAMVAGAWWLGDRRRAGGPGREPLVPLVVAATAFLAAGALSAAFPTGGSEPFVASALWPAVLVLALVAVVLPREERTVRIGVLVYLAGVLLAGALATPMGGNATRLAALAGGPVAALALWGRRPLALALLALPLLWWQWYPPVRDATEAWSDPSATASYWAPIEADLTRRLATSPGRVEVVPTARRGEARRLPPTVPIARGWIRQLDRDRSPLFYDDLDGPPTSAGYRSWLEDEAVSWIVLTDATPDGASEDEAALLRDGRVPGVVRAGGGAHWTLWRVVGARGIVSWSDDDATGRLATPGRSGAAGRATAANRAPRLLQAGPGSLRFDVPRGGLVDLRIRWSPYLRARGAGACVARGRRGWTVVRTRRPGTVSVDAAFAAPWRRPGPRDCRP